MLRAQKQQPRDPGVVLLLQIPRTNEKKELAAEQMFASLHGLLTGPKAGVLIRKTKRERVSFEIAVKNKRIGFYVWVPTVLKGYVEEQIYAQYPNVNISEVRDYIEHDPEPGVIHLGAELKLMAHEALPIKTFPSFEVDPLAAITATLAQFADDEEAWLQIVMRPANDSWYKRSERYAASIRSKGSGGSSGLATALWAPPESKGGAPVKLAEYESARANAAEEKSHKLAYEVAIRVVYRGHAMPQARMRLQAITASFKQFNTTYLNGFVAKIVEKPSFLTLFRSRDFLSRGFVCNIEEVASLYHLPHTNVETPNILWANAKTAEPPATLPLVTEANRAEISPVAVTNFRGQNTMFGLNRADRGRHLYIIGQTGVGKSGMLELLTISDIYSPYGFAVIDPHGDYALSILRRIPAERIDDVIYFNPVDMDYPIAFNPMEVTDPKLKTHTASELIGVLKRMFDSWGPRLEYILRYSLLALLDYPDSTMLDITRILTDKKFRNEVLTHVQDPVVRNFWLVEFASWNDKFAAEAVAPVLNKVGAFTANPIVRNIIGQPKSSFNIRQIMDERKILIVNLSRGLIGEDNAGLLGALLVTKMQLGAMSRADIDHKDRVPFYLYVDEFQNFATDSFATILSEARKYALNLTVANQYIAQMSQEVRDAVFGNVGSIIAFRTSADDARIMQKYFEPHFEEHDLVHMHNLHFAISMIINGEKMPAFSATSLRLPPHSEDYSQQIIHNSREKYAIGRGSIESFMHDRYVTPAPGAVQQKPKPAAKPEVPAKQTEKRQSQAAPPEAKSEPASTEKPKTAKAAEPKKSKLTATNNPIAAFLLQAAAAADTIPIENDLEEVSKEMKAEEEARQAAKKKRRRRRTRSKKKVQEPKKQPDAEKVEKKETEKKEPKKASKKDSKDKKDKKPKVTDSLDDGRPITELLVDDSDAGQFSDDHVVKLR